MEPRTGEHTYAAGPPANGGPTRPALSAGRLLVIFAPVLVLIASTAALAVTAWLIGRYRAEMLIAAEVTGAAAGMLAMFLLYRQVRQRQKATTELQSVTARVSDIAESAMDPIITIDASQRIVLFNSAAETVTDDPTLPSRQHEVNNIKDYGFSGRQDDV